MNLFNILIEVAVASGALIISIWGSVISSAIDLHDRSTYLNFLKTPLFWTLVAIKIIDIIVKNRLSKNKNNHSSDNIEDNTSPIPHTRNHNLQNRLLLFFVFLLAGGIVWYFLSPPTQMPQVGTHFYFGSYYSNPQDTQQKAPIEWIVIDVNEKNSQAMVMSYLLLDCGVYNTAKQSVSWEKSSIRQWLNNDFYNEAFSPTEKKGIPYSTIYTKAFSPDSASTIEIETYDKIFLLSATEILQKNIPSSWLSAFPTEYAKDKHSNIKTDFPNGPFWWWLRDCGYDSLTAADVKTDGSINAIGQYVTNETPGIRPVMWLDVKFIPEAKLYIP